jgi:hypothetical protein
VIGFGVVVCLHPGGDGVDVAQAITAWTCDCDNLGGKLLRIGRGHDVESFPASTSPHKYGVNSTGADPSVRPADGVPYGSGRGECLSESVPRTGDVKYLAVAVMDPEVIREEHCFGRYTMGE